MWSKFNLKSSKKMGTPTVHEVIANENVEIRVYTRIKTDIRIQHDRLDFAIHYKKRDEITHIEVEIRVLD